MALKFGKWVANIGADHPSGADGVLHPHRVHLRRASTACTASGAARSSRPGSSSWRPNHILIFDLEGFELPSAASEELINPRRDVPFAILRSGIGAVLFYGVPILAILLVLPAVQAVQRGGLRLTRCSRSSWSTEAI